MTNIDHLSDEQIRELEQIDRDKVRICERCGEAEVAKDEHGIHDGDVGLCADCILDTWKGEERKHMTPETGIHTRVPFDTYLSWEALNFSALIHGRRSMLHVQQAMSATPKPPTDAMLAGSFMHAGALDPASLLERYVVMPAYDMDPENVTAGRTPKSTTSKNTLYYRTKSAEFHKAHPGKQIVEQDELDTMRGMLGALANDEIASACLAEPGDTEVAIVWKDLMTFKGRIDKLGLSAIVDYKTCADASQFDRSIARYGYHIQAAMYVDGVGALTGQWLDYILIAQETTPPYAVRAAPLASEAIEQGRSEYQILLREYVDCVCEDRWTGYAAIEQWELPAWAKTSVEEGAPW